MIFAETSIGDSSFTRLSIRFGNLTCINLTTAGQADDINGFFIPSPAIRDFVASVTNSAPLATSYTSSKPISLKAFKSLFLLYSGLNWLYNVGAGIAILYLKGLIHEKSSVIAIFA